MARVYLFLVVMGLLTGCTSYDKEILTGSPMPLDNVYVKPDYEHSKILNVLLLPVGNPRGNAEVDRHYDDLVEALLRNFGKFNYFNIQAVHNTKEFKSPVLDMAAGRIDRARLGEIGQTYGVQAVMQVDIEEFRTFAPMQLQVRTVLVDASSGERVWQFHHTFDADDAEVINMYRVWWNSRESGGDKRSSWFELSQVRPSVYSNFVFYMMARSYERTRVKNIEAAGDEEKVQDLKDKEVMDLQEETKQRAKQFKVD